MMKTKQLSVLAVFLLATVVAFAGNKTEKFKVYGNCGMCETRIEKAANGVDGVAKADWNKDTKIMEVTFDESKTSKDKIEKAIAKVGHDTDMLKANDEAYRDLPGCCKYERPKAAKKMEGSMEKK